MAKILKFAVMIALVGICDTVTSINQGKSRSVVMSKNVVPEITLSNEVKIPQLGLGTYCLAEGDETYNSVLTALKLGYRHVDRHMRTKMSTVLEKR